MKRTHVFFVFSLLLGPSWCQKKPKSNSNKKINFKRPHKHDFNAIRMLDLALKNLKIEGLKFRSSKDFYLRKYGCWCFQDPETGAAGPRYDFHGEGLDEFDNKCRDLHRSQRCVVKDLRDKKLNCDVDDPYPFYRNETSGEIVCGFNQVRVQFDVDEEQAVGFANEHEEHCAMENCKIEREFVYEIIKLLKEGKVQNQEFKRIKDFEYLKYCPNHEGQHNQDEEHSINYFRPSDTGTHKCCGDGLNKRPFNDLVSMCCDDKVVNYGECG